jgi:hypothetical protein
MLLSMEHRGNALRSLIAAASVLAGAMIVPAAAGAKAVPKAPTPAQIQTALRRAESSPDLWATVNVCDTRRHPDVIGIRAQMPALGFESTLRMRFLVEYWSTQAKAFKAVPGATRPVTVGLEKTGLHQEGVQFPFPPHSGSLRGTVKFEWATGHRLLGRSIANTTHGHRDADFGDPAHYSAPRCVIR